MESEIVTDAAYVLFYKLRGFEEQVGFVDQVFNFASIMQAPKLEVPITSSAIKEQRDGMEGDLFAVAVKSASESQPSEQEESSQ